MEIRELTGNIKKFAEACYDNSISELKEALLGEADPTDCINWGITGEEWRIAITSALSDRQTNPS